MLQQTLTFTEGVKTACGAAPGTPFVLLGNFEVEDEWAKGETGLPSVGGRSAAAIVNRMDEFALLLAGAGDHVVLKSRPDNGYLDYLDGLGLDLPGILVTDVNDPAHTVAVDALASPRLQQRLHELALGGARLWPHGMSALEERLCALTSLTPALPPAALVKRVNSKIYSRRLATELGLAQARGWECESAEEFAEVARAAAATSLAGGRRVGVKDAYGVSGKGIVVVDDERRMQQLVRMVQRTATRSGNPWLSLVVEEWADKAVDLNYHFTVSVDGGVRFDFVKEAITDRGVHKGHRFPARISDRHAAEVEDAAQRIGARLAAEGFHGPVGVDAIITADGELLPVLEINARNNMSTYQTRLQERFVRQGSLATARQYDIRPAGHRPFARTRDILGELLLTAEDGRGLLVNNHATVNAAATGEGPHNGRLYGLLIARDEAELDALDTAIAHRLAEENADHE
ncbi:preATP grasp domain-containing protein [Streptomyces lonarensis]|uniref:ATP-grasp domain-containing protein n=1 Tax=Streptomyces lonarensis TaxID=700599 RepID=A0A7X6I1C6_9ACTN|nr:ATP-grasp domain-containing protein [Streptomyces lonarensis]NJQ08189.1 ATP-grasp domain-containing protein [Streptomyces lonarensis]